jgi:hypothetical protein
MEDSRNRFRSVQWDHYDEHQKYFELGKLLLIFKNRFFNNRCYSCNYIHPKHGHIGKGSERRKSERQKFKKNIESPKNLKRIRTSKVKLDF